MIVLAPTFLLPWEKEFQQIPARPRPSKLRSHGLMLADVEQWRL